jgi:hypothetical protein
MSHYVLPQNYFFKCFYTFLKKEETTILNQ